MPTLTGDPKLHDKSEFAESLSGHCLCGSIHVTITDSELFTKKRGHLCHCANCRKASGSFCAANLNIEEEKVKVEDRDGTKKIYDDYETGSGRPLHRAFCSACGCAIYSASDSFPGRIVVKMGIFPRIPDPEFETFAAHRHAWEGKHDGVKMFKIRVGGETLDE